MIASAPKVSNLGLRLITTLVMAPLSLGLIWLGGWPYTAFIAIGGILVLYEWRGITGLGIAEFAAGAVAIGAAAILAADGNFIWAFGLIAGLAVIDFVVATILRRDRRNWAALGVLYTAIPVVCLVILRATPQTGLFAVAFVMIAVWVTDTAAYLSGRAIGGAKLWPSVSPNKTWAGLIGGAAGAAVAGLVLSLGFEAEFSPSLAVVAALLAIISQGGDLAESALKRHFGVKDSGFMFPGHGGILDRVDGLIAASVAAAIVGAARAGFENAADGLLFWYIPER